MSRSKDRIRLLERKVELMEAQLVALNAPFVRYNEIEKAWEYHDRPRVKKRIIHSMLLGKGYLIINKEVPYGTYRTKEQA